MQRSNNRRRAEYYRRRRNQQRLIVAAMAVIIVILIVVAVLLLTGGKRDAQQALSNAATPTPTAEIAVTPTPTVAPTPVPTQTPSPYAAYRPTARSGWLPVFRKADTQEKIIAITVDDCFQAENLRTIVQTAIDNGGKLTIFPIGEQALRDKQSEILKWAWENGMELENHTFTHSGLYNISDEMLAKEMYMQNLALSKILDVEYTCHFIRPRGGDARNDQRIHAYADQLDYYGVAHWSVSGSDTALEKLPEKLQPGAVYLFHTTDKDLEKLVRFIPYAVSQGYRLVTLNEMFGYPENETAPLSLPIESHVVPTLAPYDVVPVAYSKPAYAWGVYQMQEKLIALGYLEGEPDGVFGDGCKEAVTKFQQANGLPATGEADLGTQNKIDELFNTQNL